MYKLQNKPNTSENGHFAKKLQQIEGRKFSKISIHGQYYYGENPKYVRKNQSHLFR